MDSTLRFAACFSPHPTSIPNRKRRAGARLGVAAALLGLAGMVSPEPAAAYVINNLVSDLPGVAARVDPNLVNPWGLTHSATSPWWVSDNGAGVSTLYNGNGAPRSLVVTIPGPGGTQSAPTGVVFNGNSASFGGSRFIFATEDGTIAAWPNSGTVAPLVQTVAGAVYKGLAIGTAGGQDRLYATNFHNGTIDVFDSNFKPVIQSGFVDPNLPPGYAPFGIQNIGGNLYVTYAKQDASGHDDVAGPGHGFIDEFDTNGNLLKRIASDDTLNSPWGLALAPSHFGRFSNDLLVGNFGDGRINAFDLTTDKFVGQLDDGHGNALDILGLWGLGFGNGANAGSPNALYFTAGIPGPGQIEDHGLFGVITAPEPSSLVLLLGGLAALGGLRRRRRSRAAA